MTRPKSTLGDALREALYQAQLVEQELAATQNRVSELLAENTGLGVNVDGWASDASDTLQINVRVSRELMKRGDLVGLAAEVAKEVNTKLGAAILGFRA